MKIKPQRKSEAIGGRRVRVIVAERNPLVVSALREMLECDGRFEFLGSMQSGKQLLDLAAAPQFDVAILAWKLSDMDGGEFFSSCSGASSIRA